MTKAEALQWISTNRKFFRKDFLEWIDANWHIYQEFEREAMRIIKAGRTHYSARTIVEVMRHESTIREAGDGYKINDHRSPDLARLFVAAHPRHINFWEYRRPDWPNFKELIGALA